MAPDKLKHLEAGAVLALCGALAAALLMALMLLPMAGPLRLMWVLEAAALGAVIAPVSAGITKEWADWQDNQIFPGMHGVEWQDAACTAVPGLALALLLLALRHALVA